MPRARRVRKKPSDPELAALSAHDRLLICARDHFQQRGFDGVNLREIMDAAAVTQPTIYYYFQNKDGLFLAVLLDILQELDEDFNRALAESGFAAQLRGLARAFARRPAPDLALLVKDLERRVELHSQGTGQGIALNDARPAYLYLNQLWPRSLETALREARRGGEIQAGNPVFLAHYLLTLLLAYPHSPFNGLAGASPDLSSATLLDFLYASLRATGATSHI